MKKSELEKEVERLREENEKLKNEKEQPQHGNNKTKTLS